MQFPHKEKILIIITSSSVDPCDIDKAKKLGIKYCLAKPISREVLRKIVFQELGLHSPKIA